MYIVYFNELSKVINLLNVFCSLPPPHLTDEYTMNLHVYVFDEHAVGSGDENGIGSSSMEFSSYELSASLSVLKFIMNLSLSQCTHPFFYIHP